MAGGAGITYERFEQQLIQFFYDESIEDGVSHPAERTLEDIFGTNPAEAERWVQQVSEKHFSDPTITAGLIQCLGRSPKNFPFGYNLAEKCLQQNKVPVREAAVTYLEAKGGPDAIRILSAHHETVKWLGDYISKVIDDLQK